VIQLENCILEILGLKIFSGSEISVPDSVEHENVMPRSLVAIYQWSGKTCSHHVQSRQT
jgi:hypothetical protein